MYGHSGSMFSGGMFFGGGVLMWIFWIAVLVLLVYAVKAIIGSVNRNSTSSSSEDALEILKQRFAKGEIDEAEFELRKRQLK